jgi:ferredoxin
LVVLPAEAAFGEVSLVESRCTVCMACVSQCPGGALMEGGDRPQLKFVEDNCIQCGMCARVCPEDAIAPSPRYLFDGPQRRKVRVLKEEVPFQCVRCGKPFATHSVIRKITQKLRGHPNFGPRELARLEMCEDCRIKVLFEEEMSPPAAGHKKARK